MSKKHRNKFKTESAVAAPSTAPVTNPTYAAHAAEYRTIRNDLIRVIVLNLIFLVGVLAVYYTNRSSGYLQRIFEQIF